MSISLKAATTISSATDLGMPAESIEPRGKLPGFLGASDTSA